MDDYARAPGCARSLGQALPHHSDFDSAQEKRLLLFAAGSQVIGVDRTDPTIPAGGTLLDTLSRGSSHPDEDYRNCERRLTTSASRTNPDGRACAGRSGAAKHGQTRGAVEPGACPLRSPPRSMVLRPIQRYSKTIRRRFVVGERAPIITLAARMAQIHLIWALLAAYRRADQRRERALSSLGQGFHYPGCRQPGTHGASRAVRFFD